MDKYLLTPIAKVLFAQEYHADEKEWIDCEWNASSEKTRWLLTERAKTLLPLFDEAYPLIREEVRKETAEEILEYISDLNMIKDNQEDAERFECLRIKYGIEDK